ncbi:MAG TPA: LemA family protein [Candidatus Limnocylindrales bacterium]|nr:LemA family protein [Candidatus Limnocylindrales bacterium]
MLLELAAAFGAALALWLVVWLVLTTYNGVVALRQRIDKAWTNVGVALEQRHDELPRLLDAVRDLMRFERDVLEEVTRLRAAYRPDEPIPVQAATAAATSSAVRNLFATLEQYPAIRAQENVLDLQDEIERLETVIADRRELYNDMVALYNIRISQVPGAFLAPIFGWRMRPLFGAEPIEREQSRDSL